MTELAAPQISSLMEALPGIAAVLRSPVANAIVALSRAGAGLEEFRPAEAEELLRYGVRRNLLAQEEVDRILAEIREALSHRPARPGAVAEKPKKAPIPAAPVPEHRVAAAPAARTGLSVSPAKPVPKVPVKPAVKASVKPLAKVAPHKTSGKAPAKASHAPKSKKGVAVKSPASARKGSTKSAHKKPAARKGHR